MKQVTRLILWLGTTFLLLSKAQGYQFTQDFIQGTFWRSFPIQMHRYSHIEASTALLQEVTDAAQEEWEGAAGFDLWNYLGPVVYSATHPAGSNIIRYSDNFTAETGFDDQYTLAVTVRFSVLPYIVRTEIILNSKFDYLKTNANNNLYKTILHELGHTLGLDHSHEDAIMEASIGLREHLSADDQAAVIALVQESVRRQEKDAQRIRSELETDKGLFPITCGTVEFSPRQGGGPGGFFPSFVLGAVLFLLAKAIQRGKKFLGQRA